MREAVEKFVNQKWDELNSAVDVEYAIRHCYHELMASIRFDLGIDWDVYSEYEVYCHWDDKPHLLEVLYHRYLIGKDIELLIREESFYANNFIDNPVFFILPVIETMPNDKEVDEPPIISDNNYKHSQVPIFRLSENDFTEISASFFEYVCKKQLLRKLSFRHTNRDVDLVNQIDQSPQFIQHQLEARNVFNNVRIEKVRAFFGQLCDDDKLVLTEAELGNFISRAFHGDLSIEKQTLNTSLTKKTMIVKLFHLFYQKSIANFSYEPRRHCIEKYVELLTDNFYNYEYAIVSKNFSRSPKHSIWRESL